MPDKQTKNLIIDHYRKYPRLEIADVFKLVFQSSFGCEHLVSSLERVTEYIVRERESMTPTEGEIEFLDGNYARVPLSYMDEGLTAQTLGKLFFLSSKKEEGGKAELIKKISAARDLVLSGDLPFSISDFDRAVSEWESAGFPAVRHSEAFRENYAPSYRVIAREFVPFLPLLAKIDKLGQGVIAIDGGSASGKTTLGSLLEKIYDCTLLHMDDYFLPPQKRTPERLREVGGNVDYERFLSEVLMPLSAGENITVRKFDCSTMSLGEAEIVVPKKLVIVEGAYSMHTSLENYYDLTAFLDISPEKQRERITKRNTPEFAKRFFGEWIPLENVYFEQTDIKNRVKIVIEVK